MARKPFVPRNDIPYNISARCNNREWFKLPMPQVWEVMERYLYLLHHGFNVNIHSFVLMSNHFHLIATFPKANISKALGYFLRETNRTMAHDLNRINHIYGSRFFRSLIVSNHYFTHAYKYNYQNPVVANICDRVENYDFSTLPGLLGRRKLLIPVVEDTLLFEDPIGTLEWLNRPNSLENRVIIARALRKTEFKLPRNPKTKDRHPLEYELY